jgi:hypothetical protein
MTDFLPLPPAARVAWQTGAGPELSWRAIPIRMEDLQMLKRGPGSVTILSVMPFPVKTCVVCQQEFELKPDKPGFANRCPSCSEPEEDEGASGEQVSAEMNEARRNAMRDLLYRKDS